MSTLSQSLASQSLAQYSNLTYLVELIALGLVAAALLAVTISILTRFKSGKREHKKLLSLRRSAEKDKQAVDETFAEIGSMGQQIKNNAKEADMHLDRAVKKVREAEQHAETVANIEVEMKQVVDGTTERMAHIQEHWEFLLKETTESMDAININLKEGMAQTAKNNEQTVKSNEQALAALNSLSPIAAQGGTNTNESEQVETPINAEIQETLDLTLKESKELLTQIRTYQQQAKTAFSSFTSTLSGFESQAHEQFDEVFNTADVARQELNANLDESREYMKIFRKNNTRDQASIKNKSKKQQEVSKKQTFESNNLVLKGIDTDTIIENKKVSKKITVVPNGSKKGVAGAKGKKNEAVSSASARVDRPLIGENDAKSLTNEELISNEYNIDNQTSQVLDSNKDKNLISLFTKFKQHGA